MVKGLVEGLCGGTRARGHQAFCFNQKNFCHSCSACREVPLHVQIFWAPGLCRLGGGPPSPGPLEGKEQSLELVLLERKTVYDLREDLASASKSSSALGDSHGTLPGQAMFVPIPGPGFSLQTDEEHYAKGLSQS